MKGFIFIIGFLAAFSLLFNFYQVEPRVLSPCDSYGDVNKDGFITEDDSRLIEEFVVGRTTLTEEQKVRADVNQDKKVNIADAMIISQFIKGQRDTLPACAKFPPCNSYGDVNRNRYVNLIDASLIARYVVGEIVLTPEQRKRADVNRDGEVNTMDTMMIGQYVRGEINTFPVCQRVTVAAGGGNHTLAIKPDGSLWAWGGNWFGQLGLGDTDRRYFPVQVGADTNWQSVVAGWGHTLALRTDGTLWAWGSNALAGELGLGDTDNRHFPIQVGTDTNWQSIVASDYSHTLAIKTDGSLWAWGYNERSQLGLGDIDDRYSPVKVE